MTRESRSPPRERTWPAWLEAEARLLSGDRRRARLAVEHYVERCREGRGGPRSAPRRSRPPRLGFEHGARADREAVRAELRDCLWRLHLDEEYSHWFPIVLKWAWGRSDLTAAAAEPIAHDVVVEHLSNPRYQGKSPAETERILRRCLTNAIADERLRAARERDLRVAARREGLGLAPLEELVLREDSQGAKALWRTLAREIAALRRRLPESRRRPLDAYLEGTGSYAEIAARLGLSPGALTQRVNRTVQSLYAGLPDRWRLVLAPLRSLQVSGGHTRRRRATLRLVELLARQAQRELKRELETVVRQVLGELDEADRSVLEDWRAGDEPASPHRTGRRRALERLRRALLQRHSFLVRLLRATFDERHAARAKRTRPGSGPGADGPGVRWCMAELLPLFLRRGRVVPESVSGASAQRVPEVRS